MMEKGVISRQSNQDQTIISVTTMYQEMQKTLKTKKNEQNKNQRPPGKKVATSLKNQPKSCE